MKVRRTVIFTEDVDINKNTYPGLTEASILKLEKQYLMENVMLFADTAEHTSISVERIDHES